MVTRLLRWLTAAALAALAVAASAADPPSGDGDWTMASKDQFNTRYSTLAQVDRGNVVRLREAFKFETGVFRGQESAPHCAHSSSST